MTTHQLQDAKQRFSAVADQASKGQPQLVTKHGKPFVVLVSADEWEKTQASSATSLFEALRACPADLTELSVTRQRDVPRQIGL
ncbi:MAG: type II toxin-antitoxin system Phd/YefM family antitoxin [Chthoniobacterales bacterium]